MKKIKGGISAVPGILSTGVRCGLKEKGRDVALIYSQVPAKTAILFTNNEVKAAPLLISKQHLEASGYITQAIIVNSGNANACTGEQGLLDANAMAEITARCLGIKPESVLVASTGIIGVKLDIRKVEQGIREASKNLSKKGAGLAAEAIMTTDTKPKEVTIQFAIGQNKITIGAMAKGAGMICPNMGTMLVFIATDMVISQELLKKALSCAVNKSFNMIVIDGDTSTNDMVVLLSNGFAKNQEITQDSIEFNLFCQALDEVCITLAMMIVSDAEGFSRLMAVHVHGANSEFDAKKIAKSIVSSILVKCALHGSDPNWGRIMAAIGNSGVSINPQAIDIYFEDELIVCNGVGIGFNLSKARDILKQDKVNITINLNAGTNETTAWGCDLSPVYVKFNSHYRT